MNIIFLHQNFPAQFRSVAGALQAAGNNTLLAVVPLGITNPSTIPLRTYAWPAKRKHILHDFAGPYAESTDRASAVADTLLAVKSEGFVPDLVVGHGGWGETLFVRDVFPEVPILLYAEFFHSARGLDVGFDPEIARTDSFQQTKKVRARSVVMTQGLFDATRGVAPTHWQANSFPPLLRDKIDVVHEGIDTDLLRPDSEAYIALQREGIVFRPGDEVVTFINRNLEHYRGFHVFMRALPAILRSRPEARIIVIGGNSVSYGPAAPAGTTWKQQLLSELSGQLDLTRLHFVGKVSGSVLRHIMQVSAAHVYLTYPFVLSWSMLEAMSAGALVIASRTGPVTEVIEDGRNGILREFFDVGGIAEAVIAALSEPRAFESIRIAGRQTIVDRYDLKRICLPAWLRLIERIAQA